MQSIRFHFLTLDVYMTLRQLFYFTKFTFFPIISQELLSCIFFLRTFQMQHRLWHIQSLANSWRCVGFYFAVDFLEVHPWFEQLAIQTRVCSEDVLHYLESVKHLPFVDGSIFNWINASSMSLLSCDCLRSEHILLTHQGHRESKRPYLGFFPDSLQLTSLALTL